ncbi:MAG: single-stranded DNA-binding protein [Leadbetterella sp.]
MNSVQLIGNVGSNPNIRTFEKNKLASFSLATNKSFESKDQGEIKQTQWHNIVAWGKVAEQCEELIAKGKFIRIEGELRTRHYMDHENRKIYITEVVAKHVEEVAPKPKTKTFFL